MLSVWRSQRILNGPPPLRVFIGCTISPPGSDWLSVYGACSDWLLVQVVVSSAAGLDSFTASPSLVKMASSFMQSSTSGLGKHASYFTHFLSKDTNIDWNFAYLCSVQSQGADPNPSTRSDGRLKSYERGSYPPPPHWDRREILPNHFKFRTRSDLAPM